MKKQLKAVISMLLALVLFVSAIPIGAVTASAAAKLSIDVDYDYYGTAFVTVTPGDPDNYVTYTTDGTMPDENSEKYTNEIVVYSTETLRVAEYNDDGERIKGLKMTVTAKTAPVIFDIKQLGDKAEVTLTCATANAEIRYTTDGTKPSRDSKLYTDKLVLTEKTKIRARAYCDNYKTTTTYAKTVKITPAEDLEEETKVEGEKKTTTSGWRDPFGGSSENSDDDKEDTKVEEPKEEEKAEEAKEEKAEETETKNEEADDENVKNYAKKASYGGELMDYRISHVSDKAYSTVEFLPQKSTNKIVYTTDDSSPKDGGKKYSKRFKITKPTVIRAIEYNKAGEIVASIRFTAKVKCAPVTFECLAIDKEMRTIKLSTLTEDATIYYTTNGKFPTTDSKVYTGELDLAQSTQIKAIAVKSGYVNSNIKGEDVMGIAMNLPEADMNDETILYLFAEVNRYRASKNLAPLSLDENLCRAAAVRAIEIQAFDSLSRPSGGSYLNAAYEAGVTMSYSTEYRYRYFDGYYQIPEWLFETKSLINDKTYTPDCIGIGYCDNDGVKTCIVIVGKIQD